MMMMMMMIIITMNNVSFFYRSLVLLSCYSRELQNRLHMCHA